jgi:hypothetical protein
MPDRIMYVQLKTGYGTDQGPAWIGWVRFSKTWQTAYFQDRTMRRAQGADANFYDVDTNEELWVSGSKRDRTDARYGPGRPTIEEGARGPYEAFLAGAALPGRERG